MPGRTAARPSQAVLAVRHAHFEVPARNISHFLFRTYHLVPAGEESEHIDIEAGLNDLLRQASFDDGGELLPGGRAVGPDRPVLAEPPMAA